MELSNPSSAVIGALSAALAELSDVPARNTADIPTSGGGRYSYRYADLGDVLAACRPALQRAGLAVIQDAHSLPEAPNEVAVSTMFIHESGQWMRTTPLRLARGATPQTAGSAITYARRYSLLAALGLATEDDDGQAAAQQQAPPDRAQSTERTYRTPEEAQIHGILANQSAHIAAAIRDRFRAEFRCNLSALGPDRHAEALQFVRGCLTLVQNETTEAPS